MRTGSPSDLAAASTLLRGLRPDVDLAFRRLSAGFTLADMLVVLGVAVILVGLITPAFTRINAARNLNRAAYEVTGQLDMARAYAQANGTYTWVGFFEEMADQPAGTPGPLSFRWLLRPIPPRSTGTIPQQPRWMATGCPPRPGSSRSAS